MVHGQKFQNFQTLALCQPFIGQAVEVPDGKGRVWSMPLTVLREKLSWDDRKYQGTGLGKSIQQLKKEPENRGICISPVFTENVSGR